MAAAVAAPSRAAGADLDEVRALLAAAGLPVSDLEAASMAHFFVVRAGGQVIGTAGVEPFGDHALLRSVVVAPRWRGRGIGAALVEAAEQAARDRGMRSLWLLTTGAAAYFRRRGYADAPREAAPPALQACAQFAALCPSTAACLARSFP